MHASAPVPAQKDNLFGVCAAIGEDLGFNPLWLRLALGAGILWNPVVVAAAYAMMAAVVLATRLLFPDRKPVAVEQPAERATVEAANGDEQPLRLAA